MKILKMKINSTFKISLKELLEDIQRFSSFLSNVNRNLAFAGIAIIWIFKVGLKIPNECKWPLLLFVIVLSLDLLQYIYSTFAWLIYYYFIKKKTKRESGEVNENTIIKAPQLITYIQYFLFYAPKIIINIIAYIWLIFVINNKIL